MSFSRFFVLAANTSLIILFGSCFILAEVVNNGKIAFASLRDGNSEIYVMNADGSGQTRLTNNSDRDDYPTWSSDGQKIAFLRQNALGSSINLMNPDGTNQVRITTIVLESLWSFPWERFGMGWSPDGTKIVTQDGRDIITIGVEGGNRVNLTNGQFINFEPSWSPDGLKIAFARTTFDHGHYSDIYSMNSQGGDVARIVETLAYGDSRYPSWSPSSDRLAVATLAEVMGDPLLATINANGTGLEFIFFEHEFNYPAHNPKWSPDGTKLVFHTSGSSYSQIWAKDTASRSITRLTNTSSNNFHPDWQPLRAGITVSGRVVTPNGTPLRNSRVDLIDSQGVRRSVVTSSFGLYAFDNITRGRSYTVSVASKRYRFQAVTITPNDAVVGLDFVGLE